MKTNPKVKKKTVLIVDDDRRMLAILARLLSNEGHVTLKTESGVEAIAIAADTMPDLVILDLKLPDCNGIQVLSRLKKMNEGVRVVILTSYGSRDVVRSAMEIGAFDFLTKPFSFHDFFHVVHEALEHEPRGGRQEIRYA